ncbi:MAG: hypothetical protein ACKOFE_00660 [Bacteroidota bacterium]
MKTEDFAQSETAESSAFFAKAAGLLQRWMAPLIFLPNVMPLKFLFNTEIFPWAFLYGSRRNLVVNKRFLVWVAYLLLGLMLWAPPVKSYLVPLRAMMALLNACLLYWWTFRCEDQELQRIDKAFRWVFGLTLGVGLLQNFYLFPDFLTGPVKLFIDRFEPVPLGAGRGVTSLFAEPSYASIDMHYFFAYYLMINRISHQSRRGLALIAGLILFDIFVIRSITGTIMVSIYLMSFLRRKTLFQGIGIGIVLVTATFYIAREMNTLPRSVEVAYDFVVNQEYKDPLPILLEQSGFRFISIWSAYRYGILNPLGSGVGGWPDASVEAMDALGVPASALSFFFELSGGDYYGVRPTSFVAGLMLESGIVGVILFLWAFGKYFTDRRLYSDPHGRSIAVLFWFNLLMLGTIGDPIPFIIFGLCYKRLCPPETKEPNVEDLSSV